MTLEDIRAFNATRDTTYSVNKNDCRHYVNALCLAGTGVENVCSKYIRGEVFGKRILSPVTLYRGDDDADGSEAAEGVESEEAKRRRKARELAVLLPILAVTDLENMPVWDRLEAVDEAALCLSSCSGPALGDDRWPGGRTASDRRGGQGGADGECRSWRGHGHDGHRRGGERMADENRGGDTAGGEAGVMTMRAW